MAPVIRRFWLDPDLAAVEDWIKVSINGLDRRLYAPVSFIHLSFAILADCHAYPCSLPLFNWGISPPVLSVSRPVRA